MVYKEKKPRNIRLDNTMLILDYFLNSDTLIISDLEKKFNLSKTTLLKIVEHLIKKDLVRDVGIGNSTAEGGRKPRCYVFNNDYAYSIALHIFPNELYSAISNLKNEILHTFSVPLTPDISTEKMISLMRQSIQTLIDKKRVSINKIVGIAVAVNGMTNHDAGTVVFTPYFKNWPKDFPLKKELENAFPNVSIIQVDNRARFQALGEQFVGKGVGKSNIVVLQADKGVVAGIITNKELRYGTNSFAGEIGHMVIAPNSNEACRCGGHGCFDIMVASDRVIRFAEQNKDKFPESSLAKKMQKSTVNMQEIFDASNRADPFGMFVMDDVATWFSHGIANLIYMYDPEIIILHGIYTKSGNYMLESIKRKIQETYPTLAGSGIHVEYSDLGKNGGVMGESTFLSRKFISGLDLT